MPIKSMLINSVNGLIRAFLAIFSLFILLIQNLESFLLFFGLGYIGSFFIGITMHISLLKRHFVNVNQNFVEKEIIIKTLKKSSLLLFDNLASRFNLWLSTYLAFLILNAFSFKIFDLSLMMIMIVKFLGDSLDISINAKRNLGKIQLYSIKRSKYLIILILLNIFIELVLIFTNIDLVILNILFGDIPHEAQNFFRYILIIPIPLVISAYFHGRAQNLGKYSYCVLSKILGLTGSITLYVTAVIFDIADILIIGIILEYAISAIVLIYYETKKMTI